MGEKTEQRLIIKSSDGTFIGEINGDIPSLETGGIIPNNDTDTSLANIGESYKVSFSLRIKKRGKYKLLKHIYKTFYGSNNYRRMHGRPMYRRKDRGCMRGL